MAGPFSTTAGVVGVVSLSLQLLGGCIKGYILLSNAQNLGKDASSIVCILNIQEIQLTQWARSAGLLTGDGRLDRRLNEKAVEETLKNIQDLLLDTELLKKRYGLSFLPQVASSQHTQASQQIAPFSGAERVFTSISDETRQQILERAKLARDKSIFKRLRWAAVDKQKIEKLTTDIHFFIRELWNLLSPWQYEDLLAATRRIASDLIALNNKVDQLKSLDAALTALNKRLESTDAGVKDLATTANVKAVRIGLGDAQGDSASEVPQSHSIRQEMLKRLERLNHNDLSAYKPMKKCPTMGIADYTNMGTVFVEWKPLNPSVRSKILPRVENLAALLTLPKDDTFPSLTCRGIIEQSDQVAFVFHHPLQNAEGPLSLLDLFSAKDGIDPPSLSDRIRLALQICQGVRNFHRTGWLHKSLRSENILFFRSRNDQLFGPHIDFVLAGFAYSRFGAPTEISEQPSEDPKRDIYRHPRAMGEPSVSFDEGMDIYSLGTILVEIAEWRALRYLLDSVVNVDADDVSYIELAQVKPFLLSGKGKGGTSKLRTKMGDIYTSACMMCLSGEVQRTGDGFHSAMNLMDDVVQLLISCKI